MAELTRTLQTTKENPPSASLNNSGVASLHSVISNVLYGWLPIEYPIPNLTPGTDW
ncbi:MAG: hypothetical protein KF860_10945 [Cyclobacteriaceae bacterium]|nr:hypothetical protein [Cyclobacteriaceae bacterium]